MPEERRVDNNEELIREADTTENLTVTGTPLALNILRNYEAMHQIEPLIDRAVPAPDRLAAVYGTTCCICEKEIIADSYANVRFVCPHCRDAIKWLKNHIGMLEIILNKEWR